MNEHELRNLMYTAQLEKNAAPFSIRYPRGNGVLVNWKNDFEEITIGKGRMIRDGEEVAILTIGHPGNFAVQACDELVAEGLSPAHFDMRFVKPLDAELLHAIFSRFKKIITVEDGCLMGGFGSAVGEFILDHNYSIHLQRLGMPDVFIEHGEQKELYSECQFDAESIKQAVRQMAAESVLA
jgi:1-deoxy-D-xylulose-5-phosphate synthase